MKRYVTFFLITFLFVTNIRAQTFHAKAEIGGNFSQIDGDVEAGYNKLGINGGITVGIRPSERWEYSLGIIYAQKGSRSVKDIAEPFNISINYVDLPLMVSYLDYKDNDFYRIKWQAGIVVGRLISAETDAIGYVNKLDAFRKTDIAYRAGIAVFFTKHIGLSIHFQRSFNFLYNSADNPATGGNNLQYHLFQTQLIYAIK